MNVLHSVKDYVTNVFNEHDSRAGAIDVVAVQQPDGSLLCSPFCVHFGPLHNNVKQDERRHVAVEVNGQVVDSVQLKVGVDGEAYFVHPVHDSVDEDDYVTSSALLSPDGSSVGDTSEVDASDSFVANDNGFEPEEEDAEQGLRRWTWGSSMQPVAVSDTEGAVREDKWRPMLGESASMYFDAVDIEAADRDDVQNFCNHPSMSLCGHLLDEVKVEEDVHRVFTEHLVTFDVFRANAACILTDPRLRFFVDGKVALYDADMQAYLTSRVLFPYAHHLPVAASPRGVNKDTNVLDTLTDLQVATAAGQVEVYDDGDKHTESAFTARAVLVREPVALASSDKVCSDDGASTQDTASVTSESYCRQSLRPTQEELLAMGLRVGTNEIAFVLRSLHAANEVTRVTANVYLWPVTAKIVIAQIDGAISSRAATGSMFKRRDPAAMHPGAVEFYANLVQSGYQVVYVTCRGLSQTKLIDTLLSRKKIGEDGERMALPMGPVLFAPDCFLTTRSTKKTMDTSAFQVDALDALRSLFPRCVNPFYAAFGTTRADSSVFSQLGVFAGKVFIVDATSGRLRHNYLMDFQESYESLVHRMDTMFPPVYSPMIQISNSVQLSAELAMEPLQRMSTHLGASLIKNKERFVSDAVASLVRTRSLADEAFNDVNFWRIEPGIVDAVGGATD
ncbi:unnamed protein product [Hyaloperonospora brassicae]|uniref:LNS2/PITP domain-containing protein n=1 Tax=Hyaloperonospora brassicae TaxID=162125 RepID=A0AAV0UZQ4_HYABA|nr:unnamed protein product [Hyaloperonospora brassicae]